jgi:exodeoxyribonuclease VII small subunit
MWCLMAQVLSEKHCFHDHTPVWDKMRQSTNGWITLKYAIRLTRCRQVSALVSIKVTMSKKSLAESTAAPASFEEAMAELAELVTQMEGGQLPLEASVAAYARGSELVRFCAAQLEKVEAQVKVLEGDMLKPFTAADNGEALQ